MPEAQYIRIHKVLLALLCLAALAGIGHSMWFRATPAAFVPDLSGLEADGLALQAVKTSAAQADESLAFSDLGEWRTDPAQADGQPLRLMLTGVHSRTDGGFEIEAMGKHPALPKIEDRRQLAVESGNALGTTVALGQNDSEAALQTCLTPGGLAHVVKEELTQAVEAQRQGGIGNTLLRLVGLKPNIRWECLLVSISMPKDQASDEALLDAWSRIYPTLRYRLEHINISGRNL